MRYCFYSRTAEDDSKQANILTTLFQHSASCCVLKRLITVEPLLSGLIGMAKEPDMQKIRIIGFLFEYKLHWQFQVELLLFTICTCV
jgi:hypothetical protein